MHIPIDGGHFFAGQGVLSAVWLFQISDTQRRMAALESQRWVSAQC
jgi:hypothetical protein